jgi:hypothetical protein
MLRSTCKRHGEPSLSSVLARKQYSYNRGETASTYFTQVKSDITGRPDVRELLLTSVVTCYVNPWLIDTNSMHLAISITAWPERSEIDCQLSEASFAINDPPLPLADVSAVSPISSNIRSNIIPNIF